MTKDKLPKSPKLPNKLPALIVFDLDDTIWPSALDVVEGPPYTHHMESNTITNKSNVTIELFEDIPAIFAMIKSSFPNTKIAVASRNTEPDWIEKALQLFVIPQLDNIPLYDVIDYIEIEATNKIKHFKAIAKNSGIAYEEMLFFDDNMSNARVKTLGVHFVHVGWNGLTLDLFHRSLARYANKSSSGPAVQMELD